MKLKFRFVVWESTVDQVVLKAKRYALHTELHVVPYLTTHFCHQNYAYNFCPLFGVQNTINAILNKDMKCQYVRCTDPRCFTCFFRQKILRQKIFPKVSKCGLNHQIMKTSTKSQTGTLYISSCLQDLTRDLFYWNVCVSFVIVRVNRRFSSQFFLY